METVELRPGSASSVVSLVITLKANVAVNPNKTPDTFLFISLHSRAREDENFLLLALYKNSNCSEQLPAITALNLISSTPGH